VRPDQARQRGDRCERKWSDEEIATGRAEVVLLGGFYDVTEPRFLHPRGLCGPPERHADIGRWVRDIRARRAANGGPRMWFVHQVRFDLVADTQAALPGFDADFLLRADRPWESVLAFFTKDRSPGCPAKGCRWSDSLYAHEGKESGPRLRDSIDKSGGPGRYRTAIYNTARPSAQENVFYPVAALADRNNPAYRAWRIAEAKRSIAAGDYDAVTLNQKFSNYLSWMPVLGDEKARDVAEARRSDATWTARPRHGFAEEAAGWVALGRELRAAGVPYAITDFPSYPIFERWDDPKTPEPEWRAIREVVLGAELMLLGRGAWTPEARYEAFAAELRAAGVHVVPVDVRCGQRGRDR
jgi:hypothetical protein